MPAFAYFEQRVPDSHESNANERLLQIIRQDDRLYLQVGDRDDDAGLTRLWLTNEQAAQFGKGYARALHELTNGDDPVD